MRELTQKDILEKHFNSKMRGYSPEEVDEFLDIVMQDYRSFEQEIESLKSELVSLRVERDDAVKESKHQKSTAPVEATDQESKQEDFQHKVATAGVTNFDILKRISNLEREVFGAKLNHKEDEF